MANRAPAACLAPPAVFAMHPRRLSELYSACSLGCGFSEGTIRSRSDVANSQHTPGWTNLIWSKLADSHGAVVDLPQRAAVFSTINPIRYCPNNGFDEGQSFGFSTTLASQIAPTTKQMIKTAVISKVYRLSVALFISGRKTTPKCCVFNHFSKMKQNSFA
jgi:hypothetical protein